MMWFRFRSMRFHTPGNGICWEWWSNQRVMICICLHDSVEPEVLMTNKDVQESNNRVTEPDSEGGCIYSSGYLA